MIPFLPPTSNNIYVTNRSGVKFLTKEGSAFKKNAISHVQQEKMPFLANIADTMRNNPLAVFEIDYVLYFDDDDILNKSYGSGKKAAAKTRYKRMDVENRVKLLSDSVCTAIGVDDSLFFRTGQAKCSARMVGGVPQIHVYFYQADPMRFGL